MKTFKWRHNLISSNAMTHSVKLSFFIYLLIIICTAFFSLILLIMFNGLYMIIRTFIYTSIYSNWESLVREVFGGVGYSFNVFSFWFVLIFTALFFITLMFSKMQQTNKIFVGVIQFIVRFLSLFFDGLELLLKSTDRRKTGYYPYTETERKIQSAEISEYYFKTEHPESYMDFIRHISGIKDYDLKIGYAYRVLCELYKKNEIALKISDTPREIRNKAEKSFSADDVNRMTYIIEKVKFMQVNISEAEKSSLLSEICTEVKKYF